MPVQKSFRGSIPPMDAEAASDEDIESLVRRSRSDDREAFALLVRRLHGRVRGLLFRLAVRPPWIDDVAQEVFLELYRSLPRYEGKFGFHSWLRSIARNVVARHVERQQRDARLRTDPVGRRLRQQEERQSAPRLDDPGPEVSRLRRCLELLPVPLRRVLTMRYEDEQSSETIASSLGRSAVSVRMALFRARRLLADCLSSRKEAGE